MEQAYSQYKSCTEERDMMYEALMREKWERDHIYRDKWLENQAKLKLEQGLQQGIEQGLQQGLQQGVSEKSRETAKLMKQDHMDLEKIIKFTGLTKEEISRL